MFEFSLSQARATVGALALSALAACSGGASRPAGPAAIGNPVAEIDAIVDLLNRGDADAARKRLRAALKRAPQDSSARLLLDSIERDARTALGPISYAYTVRPGDTMLGLADRLLGNRLKFYQLSRYNVIATPATLSAGTTLRIPGEPPRLPQPRPESQRPPAATAPVPRPRPSAIKPPAARADPAAARRARAAGLAALNAGNVDRAVAQLRRAAALDPGSAPIQRDLQRAQRIAATVRAAR